MTVLLAIVYNGYPIGRKLGVSICLNHMLDMVRLMIHLNLHHFRNFQYNVIKYNVIRKWFTIKVTILRW